MCRVRKVESNPCSQDSSLEAVLAAGYVLMCGLCKGKRVESFPKTVFTKRKYFVINC